MQISAPVKTFKLNGHTRSYIDVTLPFSDYHKYFRSNTFSALKGTGEQRAFDPKHARKIASEMLAGNYTPTQHGACLGTKQRKNLLTVNDGVAVLELREDDPISLTDGQHRGGSGLHIIDNLPDLKTEVDGLPVDIKIMLDGNAKRDFLNLQAGKLPDKSHMFSMKVHLEATPEQQYAWNTAKLLSTRADSPFFNMVRMDSKAGLGLPVTTLCAKSGSDQSTSLIGLAKVCMKSDRPDVWAANCVVAATAILKEKAPDLLSSGKVLTPPPEGSKGSATMLVGLGICVAHWLNARAEDIPGDDLEERLVAACQMGLDRDSSLVKLSAQTKRGLMNEFCTYFFDGWEDTRHGVPEELLQTLSVSAYAVPKKG